MREITYALMQALSSPVPTPTDIIRIVIVTSTKRVMGTITRGIKDNGLEGTLTLNSWFTIRVMSPKTLALKGFINFCMLCIHIFKLFYR